MDRLTAQSEPETPPEAAARSTVVRAIVAVAVLKTVRALRRSAEAGRPVPVHQALRMYRRHRCEIDPAWEPVTNDAGTEYVRALYATRMREWAGSGA